MTYKAIHTKHSIRQSQQHGVIREIISDTIGFGKMVYQLGLRILMMAEKNLNYSRRKQYADRVKNTVIVLAEDNSILIVYKNAVLLNHIRKKSGRFIGRISSQ